MPWDDFRNFLVIKKIEEDKQKKNLIELLFSNKWKILLVVIFFIIIFFIYNIFFTRINVENLKTENYLFQVNTGESINHIAERLKEKNVIDSSTAFKIYLRFLSNKKIIQAGIYKFTEKDSLVSVAYKIINADYAISPIKITIPEGSDNVEIAKIINKSFTDKINLFQLTDDFSEKNILEKIKDKEGYLFPETYLFLPNISLGEVINKISDNFFYNIKDLFKNNAKSLGIYSLDVKDFPIDKYFNTDKTINLNKRLTLINQMGTTTVSIKDIITMASYLEGEANNEQDMRMVSGVLWARLRLNYPLQIDAARITYKEKGFTATPINNPGLIAIKSALTPINSGYIYYITGNNGKTYYAKTYKEHLENINKYLR